MAAEITNISINACFLYIRKNVGPISSILVKKKLL